MGLLRGFSALRNNKYMSIMCGLRFKINIIKGSLSLSQNERKLKYQNDCGSNILAGVFYMHYYYIIIISLLYHYFICMLKINV